MKVLVFYVSFSKSVKVFEKNLNKFKKYLKIKKINDYDLCIVNNNPQLLIKKKITKKKNFLIETIHILILELGIICFKKIEKIF